MTARAVCVPAPLDRLFDYALPEGLDAPPGAYVEIPFGSSRMIGVVWGAETGETPPDKLKPVARVLDLPPMPAPMRRFIARAADYTLTPLGSMLRLSLRAPGLGDPPPERILLRPGPGAPERMTAARDRALAAAREFGGAGVSPSDLSREAGVSASVLTGLTACGALERVSVARDAPYAVPDPDLPGNDLSPAQARAAAALAEGIASGDFGTTLLKGVTGSGKTEVYLEAAAAALRAGRQALVLLPEIALTASFIARLEARFGAAPAQWHSGMGAAERRRLWRAVATGDARIVVGARSALFLPFPELGLIVVDEEHDSAYKQEDGALYHARDMAVLRASQEGARVILASATPSLESWANAEAGKYQRIDLPERFGPAVLPRIEAVDLRAESLPADRWIGARLADEMRARLQAGEQSLLFLNRRGYAPLTLCRACGHFFDCPHCDARLVEHRFRKRLVCHQCGHEERMPSACPNCGAEDRLAASGPGVERLAEEAQALLPQARVAILSSDMAASAEALRAEIAGIAAGEADVVIGTQLAAKGHNFPLLTLVGIVDADLGLQNGDLRAAERSFQLIRQATGRAGRADRPGLALVQTAAPEHPVMQAILSGEEEAFWRSEAAERKAHGAPPFGRYAAAILSGTDEARVNRAARELARAHGVLVSAGARLLGPAPAPVARIRGRWRIRFLIKAPRGAALQQALRRWVGAAPPPSSVRLAIDVDPQSFM